MDITLKYRHSEISTADALAVGGLPVNWQCASAFTGKSRAQELVTRAPNGFSINAPSFLRRWSAARAGISRQLIQ
jgi:hypothetical protein